MSSYCPVFSAFRALTTRFGKAGSKQLKKWVADGGEVLRYWNISGTRHVKQKEDIYFDAHPILQEHGSSPLSSNKVKIKMSKLKIS